MAKAAWVVGNADGEPRGANGWAPLKEVLRPGLTQSAEGARVVGVSSDGNVAGAGADGRGSSREVRASGEVAVLVETCPSKAVSDVLRSALGAP